ncbi:MAG: carbon storage regulator CsrA [Deltaproteobacteria bacterium]|nr:carbon storage regulator CsrA [Deltaproteobacteria bacterium]
MLVLTRKSGERIRVGDHVKITVVEIRENQVKIGIEAPPGLAIHRDEIYMRIQEENRMAAGADRGAFRKAADMWKGGKK